MTHTHSYKVTRFAKTYVTLLTQMFGTSIGFWEDDSFVFTASEDLADMLSELVGEVHAESEYCDDIVIYTFTK